MLKNKRRIIVFFIFLIILILLFSGILDVYKKYTLGYFEQVGNMKVKRFNHEATLLEDGRVLITGGYTEYDRDKLEFKKTKIAEIYNPNTKQFQIINDTKLPHSTHHQVLLADGKVILLDSKEGIEIFDPKLNSFSLSGKIDKRDNTFTPVLLKNGKILIIGGGTARAGIYDPVANKFSYVNKSTNLFENVYGALLRKDGTVLIFGDKFYRNYSGKSLIELYDPVKEKFSIIGKLKIPRNKYIMTLLQDENILITGGHKITPDGYEKFKQAEIFYWSNNESKIIGNMAYAPDESTKSLLLPSGKVLFVGGCNENYCNKTSAEIYIPNKNEFTYIGETKFRRAGHRITILKDGKVLITGGKGISPPLDDAPIATKEAEIYIQGKE